MGCSVSSQKRIVKSQSSSIQFTYPRSVSLVILDHISKLPICQFFTVTEPLISISKSLKISDVPVYLSFSVLPGQDPHGNYLKICQDACMETNDENSLLMCLFDGHGKKGEEVANFCCNSAQELYNILKDRHVGNPLNFLHELAKKCDESLKASNIDVSSSGCTAIFALFTKKNLYVASIGDSRAVLGTQVLPAVLPVKEQDLGTTDCLVEIRKNRKLPSTLYSMQMTKDQKPELPEELARIIEKGGRVQQLLDDTGNKIGPYRVFDMKGNYPGLAMSRSLGDVLGTQVGIISTPMFSKHKLNKEADSFLVLASDGVWDVMDNQEVVDFVEHFRFKCQKDLQSPMTGAEISFENTCISQLLCEEARTRWYTIVEEENVMIDDISCIILEFHQKANPSAREISYIPMANFENLQVSDVRRATTLSEVSTRDPRRGSFCMPK